MSPRTTSAAKGAKAKADRLFSQLVRSRGECERCGQRRYDLLQTAHILSRLYAHTRVDFDNVFCLCAGCHHFFTNNPTEFGLFVLARRGEEGYEALLRKRDLRSKVDWNEELARLEALAETETRIIGKVASAGGEQ